MHEDFAARAARLAERHAQPGHPQNPDQGAGSGRGGGMVMGLILGLVGVCGAQVARYHFFPDTMTMTGISADADLGLALGGGLVLSLALALVLGIGGKGALLTQLIGAALMAASFHNVFHWLPGPMAAAFSPEYAATIQAQTEANTLRFRDRSYPLLPVRSDTAAPGPQAAHEEPSMGKLAMAALSLMDGSAGLGSPSANSSEAQAVAAAMAQAITGGDMGGLHPDMQKALQDMPAAALANAVPTTGAAETDCAAGEDSTLPRRLELDSHKKTGKPASARCANR